MLSLSSTARIHLCCQPVDMRKSFDGLAAAVASLLGQTPTSGHYFRDIDTLLLHVWKPQTKWD